ncbi:putative ribonuclease H-like domain-containing protein [Tanacetum coccineum]
MAPRAVLMKTGLRPLNTARPVNTAHPKTIVYSARPTSHFSKSAQSTVKRPYQIKAALTNKNFSQKVNTAKESFYTARLKSFNTARPNLAVVNAVRANQVNAVKASACWVWRPTKLNSASITLKKHNYVDGHPQKEDQGYVYSGCSKHMTWNMSYLSDFKEFDGGYVTFGGGAKGGKITSKGTLKTVPRKNNMYSVDMKNIVPKESLTCLVAKATLNESMLWHRRLGHVNFKTINKLVKENLVRGLPLKCFKNDQTCIACLKGKRHKASCKPKIQNSITQPLFMLHMDLFGLTFINSLMNKKYCLVVTDDYTRFTWVFFLASKDETSGILKSIITEIENLVDKKVKIIRCDNGTKFKNRVMNDFCEKKGIKREFSIARTLQKNGVAERRNRTLIEAARTMLADSKLPTTFWAKFDGKSDEGFFVGYSLNSKAFRVYNIRIRKVEENLHIRFLEDKPIIAGDGPKWLFDIDFQTKSMNYLPVFAGTNSNDFVDGSLFDYSLKNASNDEPQPSSDAGKKDDEGVSQESGIVDQERLEYSTQDVNTAGPSINTASTNVNTGSLNINTVSPTITTAPLKATHADFFGDETELHMSNITTTYLVPSTPNTRIHKDHSLDHVIGDV